MSTQTDIVEQMGLLEDDSSYVLSISEFEDGIKSGLYSDTHGKAQLILNGQLQSSMTVNIDRRVVSSDLHVVSFSHLLKEYGEDNIHIKYEERPLNLLTLDEYMRIYR